MTDTSQKQILPDTNLIISWLRKKRDFEEEIKAAIPGKVRIIVLDLIILELEHLARTASSTTRTWANTSLKFLEQRDYPIADHLPGPSDVDSSLVAFALREKPPTAIATLDRELILTLRTLGVPVIQPREKYGLVADAFPL